MKRQRFSRCGKKELILTVLLLLFVIVSFAYINPAVEQKQQDYHSSQLHKTIKREANTERTDYTDSEGRITDAADLGYSSVVVTRTEEGELEQYYNSEGAKVSRRYSGHYAVYREYDEYGRITCISFRDNDGEPMIISEGYATEKREYDGKTVIVRYYNTNGQPICTPLYGYGRISEYNENGKNTKTTYINQFGKTMKVRQGYAIITRDYYTSDGPENGKVKSEYYFDENEEPVALSLGQFGVHKEYDKSGRETVLTYLDAEGNPAVTNKGYTTVVRSFHADNKTATEQYFDLEGKPFALSEGQYGIRKENGQTVYLDKDGAETFNIRNLLYNHSWIVIPLAFAVVILSILLDKRWNMLFLAVCVIAIGYFTIMFRYGGETGKTIILWNYRRIFTNSNARADVLKNIWLFVPLGAILYRLCPKKIVLFVPFALSVIIEGIQYFTGTGYCELDDIISNGLGGIAGYCLGSLLLSLHVSFLSLIKIGLNHQEEI